MATFEDAVRAIQHHASFKQNTLKSWPAFLGNGQGTVESTQANFSYVRYPLQSSPSVEILNVKCGAGYDGMRVRVGYTAEQPELLQVLTVDDPRFELSGTDDEGTGGVPGAFIAKHATQHSWLNTDPVFIKFFQVTDLGVYPAGGMSIAIQHGFIPRSGVDIYVDDQTIDMTSYVPGSGALWALISVDDVGDIDVTLGSNVGSLISLDYPSIPDTPSGNFRLAAVILFAGQTEIVLSRVRQDIFDLRWPQERIAGDPGDMFGPQTANTIFAGPASGAAALPAFRAGVTDDIASGVFPIARGGTAAATANDALNNLLPSQSAQTGNSLHTDGSNSYWGPDGGGGGGTITITTLPIGTITPFGAASIPSGWLECNGAAVSRTTYADLFAVIGMTYGSGDGSTTFNLPDFRGRASVGQGTGSGLSPRALGATGGAETHTLIEAELPAHTHDIDLYDAASGSPVVTKTGDSVGNVATIQSGSAGSGAAHNNMPPFLVTAWIIKYTDTATSALIFNDAEGDPANVTLSNADGTSIYAARRDHAHALDVTIAPTWTGAHTFSNQSITITGDNAYGLIAFDYYDPFTPDRGPAFAGARARGTTASPAQVQNGDVLARFSGRGYDNIGWPTDSSGGVDVVAAETHTSTSKATRIEFMTTPSGSATKATHVTIDETGLLATDTFELATYALTAEVAGAILVRTATPNIVATPASGNARGTYAVDLQMSRISAAQVASGDYSIIVGGFQNTASAAESSVIGGIQNTASATYSSVIGGIQNTASGLYAVTTGGYLNVSSGQAAVALGGVGNIASGGYATTIGGYQNRAQGLASIAMGWQADTGVGFNGTFVFADSTSAAFVGIATNEFAIRARGGFRHAYDGSNYWTAQVSSAGAVTLNATGASSGFTFSDTVTVPQLIDSGLTASTFVYSNASQQLTSLANAVGVLTNDGAGNFSYSAAGSGTVTSIATTAPITGGTITTTGTIGITQATTATDGYLSSTDWNTFNGKQAAGNYITALTGDVTASGPGSVAATIANGAVTYAKMQDVSITARLLGRNTAGAGIVEELDASTVRTMLSINNVENTALSTWAGSANITTLGTIGTGTWQGGVISSTYGGTGINNGGRTLTLNTNNAILTYSGAYTLTVAGNASVSGTNTGDQTITVSGAVTGSGTGAITTTFATPGTLTVSSTNSNANAHTHAITTSSNPGAAAAILATTAAGALTLQSLLLTTKITTYNNVATEGYGVAAIVDSTASTARNSDQSSVAMSNTTVAADYRVSVYMTCTTGAGGAGTVTIYFYWYTNGNLQVLVGPSISLATAEADVNAIYYIHNDGTNQMFYSTLISGSYSTAQYSLHMSVERLT